MFYVYTLSLVMMIIIGYSENKDVSSTSYGNGRFIIIQGEPLLLGWVNWRLFFSWNWPSFVIPAIVHCYRKATVFHCSDVQNHTYCKCTCINIKTSTCTCTCTCTRMCRCAWYSVTRPLKLALALSLHVHVHVRVHVQACYQLLNSQATRWPPWGSINSL